MLELKHVYKVFNEGTPDEKIALKHIDLSLKKGDFLTIIGSNGAGKSTLMNIISGVLQPDYGTVKINDRDVTLMPEHKRARFIGRVFQDPMSGTAPDLTIEENLAIAFSRNRKRSLRLGITRKRQIFPGTPRIFKISVSKIDSRRKLVYSPEVNGRLYRS